MSLPDPGPGVVASEEALGEFTHRRSQLGGVPLDAVRRPGGVGTDLGRVIVHVGGASAYGLPLMHLDQLAPLVDAHQLAVQPHLHLPTRRAELRRRRVDRLLTLDVIILMYRGLAPVGDVVGLTIPRQQVQGSRV